MIKWNYICLVVIILLLLLLSLNFLTIEQSDMDVNQEQQNDFSTLRSSSINETNATGQPAPLWWRTYGGGFTDAAASIKQTSDGGFIISGSTKKTALGFSDIWLIKTNASGHEVWNKTYGSANSDISSDIQLTSDGGFIITGYCRSGESNDFDVCLIKTDSSGNEVWNRTYGGDSNDYGKSVQQTSDGGYIIAGEFGYQSGLSEHYYLWLIKTNALGEEEWNRTFGSDGQHDGNEVWQTGDGGFVIAGTYYPHDTNEEHAWLLKTDSNGTEQWSRYFRSDIDNNCNSFMQTSDGGYLMVGGTGSGKMDIWLTKTDSTGVEQWNKTYQGYSMDYGEDVVETADGGAVVLATTGNFDGENFDILLIKIDEVGDIQWYKLFGGKDYDFAYDMELSTDGNLVIAGYTMSYGAGSSDVLLLAFDPNPPVEVEKLPPTCTMSYPKNNDVITGGIQIKGTAGDADSYYFQVQVMIDNTSWVTVSEENSWVHWWNSSTVANGEHTISARAWDGVLYSDIVSVTVLVSNLEDIDDDDGEPTSECEEEGGCGSNQFLWIMIIAGIIVIVIVLILILRKKKN